MDAQYKMMVHHTLMVILNVTQQRINTKYLVNSRGDLYSLLARRTGGSLCNIQGLDVMWLDVTDLMGRDNNHHGYQSLGLLMCLVSAIIAMTQWSQSSGMATIIMVHNEGEG